MKQFVSGNNTTQTSLCNVLQIDFFGFSTLVSLQIFQKILLLRILSSLFLSLLYFIPNILITAKRGGCLLWWMCGVWSVWTGCWWSRWFVWWHTSLHATSTRYYLPTVKLRNANYLISSRFPLNISLNETSDVKRGGVELFFIWTITCRMLGNLHDFLALYAYWLEQP